MIDTAIELEQVETRFQQVDEGQEELAVDAVLVEIIRMPVGGRYHDHAFLEQAFKQAAQDHGIGNIRDLEFVEGQQAASRASFRATGGIGSSPAPFTYSGRRLRSLLVRPRHSVMRACTSCMNS